MKLPPTSRTDTISMSGKPRGVGEYFLDTMWSDIQSLRLSGGIHAVHNGYHRLLSRRFPYAIYYRVENEVARVRAILDCRRDPDWIAKKLT